MEAGYGWGPFYDWIGEVADEVLLAHPLKVRAIAEARIKTDRLDSEMLAHLLRADLIPEAYAPSKDVRAIKRVLRQRMFLGYAYERWSKTASGRSSHSTGSVRRR